ncbi:hypothetical protein ADK67_24610 [Saccharothrix sp. NRRL B-16348]|jgi:hypothetical protein|uniref:hypothetical protein n=1 Tax=Saccharothrix sp. NRRL B-16348 TaxID=1415542 RepID=UPI0006AF6008|nr:hypothetical protein [Saccharothrix sp. NRRL B-16348]KOX22394.1 hypothetical protein ADK67_24610 [Saccharothrix sp. NRRL B-16348]
MTDQDVPQVEDGEQDQPEQTEVPLNRAARRGHAQKNDGVNKIPGRPHQNTFVGRRVFRRTSGG